MGNSKKFDTEFAAFAASLVGLWVFIGLFMGYAHTMTPISKVAFWCVPVILVLHLMAPKVEWMEINAVTLLLVSDVAMLAIFLLGIYHAASVLVFACLAVYVIWSLIYTLLLHVAADIISLLLLGFVFVIML